MAIQWEAITDESDLLTTQLNSLANNTMSAASTALDNGVNLDTSVWFELNVTFGSAPTDTVPTVNIYKAVAIDGTNYATAPVTGGTDQDQLVAIIPVVKGTAAQRVLVGPFPLDPETQYFYADNQTGVAFPASGSTVGVYTSNKVSS